jgi:DNA primase large subunit
MKFTKKEIKEIIKQELRKILKEFKEPEAAKKIEITVQPDFEAAQEEILRQFAIPQE